MTEFPDVCTGRTVPDAPAPDMVIGYDLLYACQVAEAWGLPIAAATNYLTATHRLPLWPRSTFVALTAEPSDPAQAERYRRDVARFRAAADQSFAVELVRTGGRFVRKADVLGLPGRERRRAS